jgi:hypothetical protein
LRALPIVPQERKNLGAGHDFLADIVLPVFRAIGVAWSAAKYADQATRLSASAPYAASASASDAAYAASAAAASATDAAYAAATSAAAAARAFTDAAFVRTGIATGTISAHAADPFWSAVSFDATQLEDGVPASVIAGSTLWPQGQPDLPQSLWQEMKRDLLAANQDWDVWTDWYEARLRGKPSNKKFEIGRSTIPDETWRQGPATVNAEIKKLKRPPPPRKKKEPKPPPPPKIPPPRPAALEPIWSDGMLTLPTAPAETSDSEALAAALTVLRSATNELADDAEVELSDFDKRPVSYLRRIAERIPDHPPAQDELFQLGHMKEELVNYAKVVDEQWPEHLMARFHALTLLFDRTVRQSPKWRAFVRNANKDRLTAEQASETPNVAQVMADALRDEDARTFIDPPIPAKLEKLQEPLKAEVENAERSYLPAIREEGLLLAEDTVESINNIVKEVVAAALAELNVPETPARTRVAAPKTPRGIRKAMDEAFSGFAIEAENSVIKQAKQWGKQVGPGLAQLANKMGSFIFKWTKRLLLLGAGAGTVATAGPTLAVLLIRVFPDQFGWLQNCVDLFHRLFG